jgi:hypothetical protein
MENVEKAVARVLVVAAAAAVATAGCSGQEPAPAKRQATGTLPAARPGGTTVWAVGDGDGSTDSAKLAALIARARPAAFLYLGDVYPAGTAADFRTSYAPTFGRLRARTFPTPGNHEWANRATGYNPYWARVLHHRPAPYYAFRVGGWKIVSANSELEHGRRSRQARWLRRRLAGPGTCRLVFWHRPRLSAGLHGDQADMDPLWRAVAGRAALVLNGHDHDMQLFQPIHGTTEAVSGAGGHGRYPVDAADSRVSWSSDSAYGALRLRLSKRAASLAFVAASGRVMHRARVGCRP